MTDAAWSIEWHDALPSTMTRARELALDGAPSGTVVVARFQSDGRGTRGRPWHAAPDSCLMFTIIARPRLAPESLERLPLQVSESIAEVLRSELGLVCVVKHPNDILVGGCKLCGVLCISHLVGQTVEWVLCGIGLNTTMTREQLPVDTATSLAIESVTAPSHDELLPKLLDGLSWLLPT